MTKTVTRRPELRRISVRERVAALACAATACSLVVGSMMGIAAMYTGEAEALVAAVRGQAAETKVTAAVVLER